MPITKETIQAFVNSAYRLNPGSETSTNFTYSFNENVTRITQISIEFIEIPYTFYSINSLNDRLVFNNNPASFITVTHGNYNTATLANELVTKIIAQFGGTCTVTFSPTTFKMTITRGVAFNLNSTDTQVTSTLAPLLGFKVTTVGITTTVTSDSVVNIAGPNYLYVQSMFFSKFIQHKILSVDNSYKNAMVFVPVIASPGDAIIYSPKIPIRLSYKASVLTTDIIDFAIYDENDNLMNLNGLDWAMHLTFLTE
jgi:hypothetical protein